MAYKVYDSTAYSNWQSSLYPYIDNAGLNMFKKISSWVMKIIVN